MKLCVVFLYYVTYVQADMLYGTEERKYDQMPPIVTLDPYQKCLRRPGARYCTGFVSFVSDEPSSLLTYMQEYSAHTPSHFNHTKARYGICITDTCKEFYDEENDSTPNLERVLEACLNHSVSKEYKLKVKVEGNLSCFEHNDKKIHVEMADIIVAAIVMALIILNGVGSLIDNCCSKKLDWTVIKYLKIFSIPRNWAKLMAPPGTDPREKALRGLYGIRAALITLVVVVHSMLPIILICANPEFVENTYDISIVHVLLNGTVAMQTFLFISAMLLVYNLQIYNEKHSFKWLHMTMGIIKRWLRLTPSYALVLAVTATWVKYLGSGPVWDEIVTAESIDCRRDWWLHLLYINNYVDYSKCMPQAWYIAVDTQLYCFAIVVFMFCQNLTWRKVILFSLFVIGMILPALHTYFQDLNGTLIISPESIMDLFKEDQTFNHTYKRGHTNLPCYILGMASGYLVYHLQKINFDMTKYRKWRLLYWCIVPLIFCILIPCKTFYEEGPRPNIVYRALLAAFMKPFFGLIAAAFIIGMIFKVDRFWSNLMEWDGWLVPGRLSYCVYLVHVFVVRVATGVLSEPVQGTYWHMLESCLCFIVMSYVVACVFWVTVEAPLVELVKCCLAPVDAMNQQNICDKPKRNVDN